MSQYDKISQCFSVASNLTPSSCLFFSCLLLLRFFAFSIPHLSSLSIPLHPPLPFVRFSPRVTVFLPFLWHPPSSSSLLRKWRGELYLCSVHRGLSSIFNRECICLKRALKMCETEIKRRVRPTCVWLLYLYAEEGEKQAAVWEYLCMWWQLMKSCPRMVNLYLFLAFPPLHYDPFFSPCLIT